MKKLQDILISTRTMAVLLLVYAISMAVATFIENDHGTPAAKALIYNAKWFELVMLLLIINFIGNIQRYRLLRKEKWPLLVFHLAFILIFIGGAITRYISFEGMMLIREGETSNQIVSEKQYFKIQIEDKGDILNYEDVPYIMSPLHHDFNATYDFRGEKFTVKTLDYIQRKKDSLVVSENGKNYLHLVSTNDQGRENIFIAPGEAKSVNGMLVAYNRKIEGAVEIHDENGFLQIKSPSDAQYMTMATQKTGVAKKDELDSLKLRSLYTIGDLKLVVPEGVKKGKLIEYEGDVKKDAATPDLLRLMVEGPKTKQPVDILVDKNNPNMAKQIMVDGKNIMLGFGPKVLQTPFSIKLDKFVMETYPGSNSPSAYESHVQIIENGKQTPYKIYMNHVLNHGGYRFFQAGFDPDRKGTHLSVNHDFWGTNITYVGYTFLFLGLFVSLFWKGTRFWQLNKMLKDISKKKAVVVAFLLFSFSALNAQTYDGSKGEIDMHGQESHGAPNVKSVEGGMTAGPMKPKVLDPETVVKESHINKEHADKFGYALVQNIEGRIVPVNTLALDVLRKLYKRDSFHGMDANQWFLSITTSPFMWTQVPIIKVTTKGGSELLRKTKANEDGYTTLLNLFPMDPATGQPRFVLEQDYNIAFRKKPVEQSMYDKGVIEMNDLVQVFNGILSGQYMRIVPVPNDNNHTWHSWLDNKFEPDEASQKVMGPYFASVIDATKNGDWATADKELVKLQDYQHKWGSKIMPSETKVNVEVFMNGLNLFFKLLIGYTMIGGLLLILGFIYLFKPNKILKIVINVIIWIGVIGYIAHFFGLIGRWYVSGHAPWSSGYEAIMFISWVGITAGLILYRNSNVLIPAAGFLVAVIMMGFAHGGAQLDPQITPLVPVLKSYWLIVHVAIIASSYGFFALSAIIAMITLLFYIVANSNIYKKHNDKTIKELTIVSEMSLTIGLFALTVGNFLGGIWANESWGRYWSWDPKETWAFISIIIYAFVLHMRLVPGLRGRYTFHVVTMFSFCSMIMTYFGVNYYLSGLHSYAAGDPIPVPAWVYMSLSFMVALSIAAWFKYKKFHNAKSSPNNKIKRKEERTEVEP
ncbi:TPA: c-type cytochrome biogenesis protein CcsB [Elizabethkingia anophelis]|uniref:c-type cytochrome biogenesis protein CcsB n=1 Tax=Elizabethkingia anophelis TaxID=1117645 RepID=UPI000421F49D|nr:c-type cytochrome biogenesis protein CcsB [Elizabethkingia anophelis]MCT3746546.1 c-type cytochrome biogenesis protein CcsB [Elizabethkingia anophelis]MDC8027316.1 c-type cytochrome biogenesis protein CcsB [Elizabethkingia anophelis]MDV3491254.1 c-type cytochrome biogenesis protein CcsB [Elizabethkingia anophelis]MDV4131954.1 c-type cytochrome biogenesis protein CcsB [Elizabethkingia anophelis]MDV4133968.1 c-type cytochrome biogenesis protein CcsB [Elizabethkingia anophelis]